MSIITAYRPCKSLGINTTYTQQLRYLSVQKINECPRTLFMQELGDLINKMKGQGDQVVLLMDCNTDVTSDELTSWLEHHGLKNAITRKHGCLESKATYHRGSVPIDGIFVSESVHIDNAGYLAFGAFPTDHRCLWVDISFNNLFGHNMPRLYHANARRLQSDNPKVAKKFCNIYTTFIRQRSLHTRIFQLEK